MSLATLLLRAAAGLQILRIKGEWATQTVWVKQSDLFEWDKNKPSCLRPLSKVEIYFKPHLKKKKLVVPEARWKKKTTTWSTQSS